MEYYTQKEPLKLAEYGRYVQQLVDYTMTIVDRKERNEAAETIVQVMTQMNPAYKESVELQQKVWDDLFIMSNFQLDIDSPFPKPLPKDNVKAEKISYPDEDFKFKHYGKIIEDLIEHARKLENKEEQQELTQMIANLMKRSYLNYNRDSVNEEMIIDQLKSMSKGELVLDKDFKFQHTNDILGDTTRKSSTSRTKSRGKRKWKK